MTTSSAPMAQVAAPSKRGSPVTTARVIPVKANARPTRAPRSSSSTTGSSGLLERRMNWIHSPFFTWGLAALTAVRSEKASSTSATPRIPSATAGEVMSCGWRSLSTPS